MAPRKKIGRTRDNDNPGGSKRTWGLTPGAADKRSGMINPGGLLQGTYSNPTGRPANSPARTTRKSTKKTKKGK